ncbi:murein L,D-transpeptidase YcbB/YkuD [Rhizobium aquaticum]|uniref:Murein L,D-transpeptidase YcbB/YkuD n=1 Tax=Rhizobium aquaticum TaxID=1549636 RepID=A0ABV2IWQ6_9HYPH
MKTTSKAALLAAVTGMVFAAQTSGAFAQRSLFDILFGEQPRVDRRGATLEGPVGAAPVTNGARASSSRAPADFDGSDPDPLPTVKKSQYFTYKPEAQRPVKVPASAGPVVTGSVSSDGTAAPLAPVSVSLRAEDSIASAMESFYAKGDTYLWITNEAVTDRARAAAAVLQKAAEVGLNPADYKVDEPILSGDPAADRQKLMTFELEMTKAVLTYVQDDVRGRIDPNRISDYYEFKRKDVNLKGALAIMQRSPDVAAYLSSRDPSSPQFQALKAELARESGAANNDQKPRIEVSLTSLLRPGQSNPELPKIIELIKQHGSDGLKAENAMTLESYTGSPDYAPELVDVVKAFQKEKGMKPDGVIGKSTVRALQGGDSQGNKVNKLIYAMEQARWLPNDLGSRRVFINQPAFMVYYFNDNKQQLAMKVVVGGVNHQTNFFQDQIETVEFNPYWGVPRSIIVNEMLPKLRQDPSYLDRMGYEVSVRGKVVSSSALDWGRNPDVDVRQPPGNANALGQLKILFPNKFSIYMHDTPQKSFFARDMRALSHGCVRLSDPRAMAAAVLGVDKDKVAADIATGKNMSVPVPSKIPVYVAYFTAWPNAEGKVEFFDDVYGRDTYLQRAMDATTKARAQG